MFLTSRNLFLILLILFISTCPVIMVKFGLIDEDNMLDDDGVIMIGNLPLAWVSILVRQVSVLLGLGIFMFALHVTYLGGRLKNKRFNDRTIPPIFLMILEFFKATLLRAAFVFLFVNPNQGLMIFYTKTTLIIKEVKSCAG